MTTKIYPRNPVQKYIVRNLPRQFRSDNKGVARISGLGFTDTSTANLEIRFWPEDFGLKRWPKLKDIANNLSEHHNVGLEREEPGEGGDWDEGPLPPGPNDNKVILYSGEFQVEPRQQIKRKDPDFIFDVHPAHPQVEIIIRGAKAFITHMKKWGRSNEAKRFKKGI